MPSLATKCDTQLPHHVKEGQAEYLASHLRGLRDYRFSLTLRDASGKTSMDPTVIFKLP